jgi:SsrA-binding protein
MKTKVRIENKKVKFEYFIEETFSAGIKLTGIEVKRIREGMVSMTDSYCYFNDGELFMKNISVQGIGVEGMNRDRKLLLKKKQLRKLEFDLVKGYSIIPHVLYENDRGLLKVDIVLAKGKKLWDKREKIKERDIDRQINLFDVTYIYIIFVD